MGPAPRGQRHFLSQRVVQADGSQGLRRSGLNGEFVLCRDGEHVDGRAVQFVHRQVNDVDVAHHHDVLVARLAMGAINLVHVTHRGAVGVFVSAGVVGVHAPTRHVASAIVDGPYAVGVGL